MNIQYEKPHRTRWSVLFQAALVCLLAGGLTPVAQAGLVDGFTEAQDVTDTTADGNAVWSVGTPGSMLGGERDINANTLFQGGGATDSQAVAVGGQFSFSTDSMVTGTGLVRWDGTNQDPTLDPTGLGSTDLTEGGAVDAFEFNIIFAQPASLPSLFRFTMEAYTDSDNFTVVEMESPSVPQGSPVMVNLPFSTFQNCGAGPINLGGVTVVSVTCTGAGADLTQLGALQMRINTGNGDPTDATTLFPTTSLDMALSEIRTVGEPQIEILKQVSLTGGEPFFDADNPGDADVPVGELGADATYRLIVRNTGGETLINAVINDPTLGLVDVPVPGGPLAPGDERVIDAGDIGFSALFFEDRCDSIGNKNNIARVDADGQDSGNPVSDDDPANVNCLDEGIKILKQVSLTGGEPFFDADNPGDADVPVGLLGADATYRLIVTNTGSTTLINAVINDPTLGLVDVPVPGGPLAPGDERVIDAGDIGFSALFFEDRCDSKGYKMNVAKVNAESEPSGNQVEDQDPANVFCKYVKKMKRKKVKPPRKHGKKKKSHYGYGSRAY